MTTDPHYVDAPWETWDIHDDRSRAEGHVAGSQCNTPDPPIDAVDACLGADVFGGDGRYSTAFGVLTDAPTIGPFDPLRPAETLLPDGALDAGDVPMPAARVEFAIRGNTGGSDLGGAGALALRDPSQPDSAPELAKWIGVDKCTAYTRDNACSTTPSNHYAPFYRRWLPATAAKQGSVVTDPIEQLAERGGFREHRALLRVERAGLPRVRPVRLLAAGGDHRLRPRRLDHLSARP